VLSLHKNGSNIACNIEKWVNRERVMTRIREVEIRILGFVIGYARQAKFRCEESGAKFSETSVNV
jgi:hypothetical protein